jgi:hypothetical protein
MKSWRIEHKHDTIERVKRVASYRQIQKMRIPESTVVEILRKSGAFDDEKIATLIEQAKTEKTELSELLTKQNVMSDSELVKAYADEIGVPFVEINVKELNKEILKQLPEHIAKLYNMVVFEGSLDEKDEPRSVAMEDPDDVQAVNFIQKEILVNKSLSKPDK